jgi:hypothetical protein
MAANWQQIRDAFEECRELPEAKRRTWLEQRFNGDAAGRQQVLQLLEGYEDARAAGNHASYQVARRHVSKRRLAANGITDLHRIVASQHPSAPESILPSRSRVLPAINPSVA